MVLSQCSTDCCCQKRMTGEQQSELEQAIQTANQNIHHDSDAPTPVEALWVICISSAEGHLLADSAHVYNRKVCVIMHGIQAQLRSLGWPPLWVMPDFRTASYPSTGGMAALELLPAAEYNCKGFFRCVGLRQCNATSLRRSLDLLIRGNV